MEAFAYSLVNYSFLALSLGERLLLLSFAGWLLVWLVALVFHRCNQQKTVFMSPLWTIYLLWLVPAASPYFPSLSQHGFSHSAWLSAIALENPCAISPVERLGSSLFFSSALFTDRNLLLMLWCAISAGLLCRLCYRRRQFRARVRAACDINDAEILALLTQMRIDFSIARPVRLCSSSSYSAPFTMGVLHPVIFIPQALVQQLTLQELKAVLAHECAHIARRDDLAVCWQQLISVLFFFNPLLGYANRQLAQMREIYCDQLAVRQCGFSARVYARALLRVVEQLGGGVTSHHRLPVPALLAQDLQLRLHALLNPHPHNYRWRPPLVLLVGLLCVSFFLGGTGKVAAPVIEGDAVKALVPQPYMMPIENGRITSGVHFHRPLGCNMPAREDFHAGIDFVPAHAIHTHVAGTGLSNTPVRAFADGVIDSISKPPHNIGLMVRIAHAQGLYSTYVRLDQVTLAVGARVHAGQVFANMGASAQTDHVHFELTHQGRLLNPAVLFEN